MSIDNYWALKYFFEKFYEFAKNDFLITGESYGGIYVPTLSVRVMKDNTFNFKVSDNCCSLIISSEPIHIASLNFIMYMYSFKQILYQIICH